MSEPTSSGATPEPGATGPNDLPPVEEQRAELAQTVDALAQKFDVPTRVKTAAADTAHTAQIKAKDNQQVLATSGAIGAVLLVLLVVVRRRRSKKREIV
jgi:hypothetical protein